MKASSLCLSTLALLLGLAACDDEQEPGDSGPQTQDSEPADSEPGDSEPPDTGPGDSDPPDETVLTNNPDGCPCEGLLMPSAGEEGQLAGIKLIPGQWPYRVDSVAYTLSGVADKKTGILCQSGLAHRIEVFKASSATPPAEPEQVTVIDVAEEAASERRVVVGALEKSLVLEEGEYLFVGVELPGAHPEVSCLVLCQEVVEYPDRNYWSNATEAPYDWTQLSTWGIPGNIALEASGGPS